MSTPAAALRALKIHHQSVLCSPASTRASPTSAELDHLLVTLSDDQIRYLKALLSSDLDLADLRCQLDAVNDSGSPTRENDLHSYQVTARLHDLLKNEEAACSSCKSNDVLISQLEAEVRRLNGKLSSESARFLAEKEEWREALENGGSQPLKAEIRELRKSVAESKQTIEALKASHAAELNGQRARPSIDETETETAVFLKRENVRLRKMVEEGEKLVSDLRLTVLRLASKPGDEGEECELSAAYAKVVTEKIEAEKVVSALQHSLNSMRHEHTEMSVYVESLKRQLDFSKTDKVQLSDQIDLLEKERAQLRQALLDSQVKSHTLQSETDALRSGLQAEVDTLQQNLLGSKQTVAALHAQISELTQSKASAEAEAKRVSEELTRLRCGSDGELLRLRESAEEAESNLRKLEVNVTTLTNELEASERRAASLSAEVDRLRSSAAAFEAEAAQLKRKMAHTVEESRQELRSARVELARLRGSREDSDRIIANLHADIRRLNANKEETERTLTMLHSEIAPLKAARDEALQKVVDLEVQVTRLLEEESPARSTVNDAELAAAKAELEGRIQELTNTIEEREEMIECLSREKQMALQESENQHQAALMEARQRHDKRISELEAELRKVHDEARKIVQCSFESSSTANEELSAALDQANEQNVMLTAKIQDLEESVLNVSMLEEHIRSLEEDIKRSERRENDLTQQLGASQAEVEKMSQSIKEMEAQLEAVREQLAQVVAAKESADQVREELKSELEQRKREIDELRSNLEEVKGENDKLTQHLSGVQSELDDARGCQGALESQVSEARAAAAAAEAALNESLEAAGCSDLTKQLSSAAPLDQVRLLKVALKQKTSSLNDERAKALMLDERMKEKDQLMKNVQKQMLAVEEAWKHEYETYEAHLHKTCKQVSDLTTEKERLQAEVCKHVKEISTLKNLMEKNNDEVEAVQSFRKEQKTLTKTIQVLESKCDQLRKRIVELESMPTKEAGGGSAEPKKVDSKVPFLFVTAMVAIISSSIAYLFGTSSV